MIIFSGKHGKLGFFFGKLVLAMQKVRGNTIGKNGHGKPGIFIGEKSGHTGMNLMHC